MSQLWIGNFTFEDQLIQPRNASAIVQRLEAELAPCLAAAASPEDFILCPEAVDDTYLLYLEKFGWAPPQLISPAQLDGVTDQIHELQPWGVNQQVRRLGKKLGIKSAFPSDDSVRLVNSRSFSFKMSQETGCLLTGESIVTSISGLSETLNTEAFLQGFVIKSEFGQSGRGQLMGSVPSLTSKQFDWVRKRLNQGEQLFLEPRLDVITEFGIQWDIPQSGTPPNLFGITKLQCYKNGGYAGSTTSLLPNDDPELESIIAIQRLAVTEMQRQGYFGPVGIDAMLFQQKESPRQIRPLQDINARWTMGRLAIHWAERCFPDQPNVSWLHCLEKPTPSALRTSPDHVGGKPVQHVTWCSR